MANKNMAGDKPRRCERQAGIDFDEEVIRLTLAFRLNILACASGNQGPHAVMSPLGFNSRI
jgi:hypothetical protein